MNPFMMGPAAMTAWSNPDLFSTAMAAQGISPNAVANPLVPQGMDQMDPLAALMTPSMMAGTSSPAVAAAPGQQAPGTAMPAISGLGQAVAPEAARPIMSGGVSGAQDAPKVTAGAANSGIQQAVMKLLMNGGPQTPMVPGLAGLVRGI